MDKSLNNITKHTNMIEWAEKTVPLASLKPFERNPRRITKDAFDRLKKRIERLGYHQRMICQPDGGIIGGHARLKALRELGFKDVKILVPSRELTMEEFREALISDNGQFGEWDMEILSADFEPEELIDWGVPEALIGDFTQAAPSDGLTDDDEVPELQADTITRAGDVWLLGNHRLSCGDSTNATDVERLLKGIKPHLMVTDPPYGVEYDADWRNKAKRADGTSIGASAIGKVENDSKADWTETWALFPGEVVYVWHAGNKAHVVAESLIKSGFDIRAQIIWAKSQFVIGRGHYHPHHEPCWYAVRQKGTGHWAGDRKQSTLWQIDKPRKSETGHSTQKPVECMLRPILNNSSEGQAVYEPFSGSGTTIIAAEKSGRHCYAMEIAPAYVDLAVRRWQQFTGQQAILEADGKPFPVEDKKQNTEAKEKSE